MLCHCDRSGPFQVSNSSSVSIARGTFPRDEIAAFAKGNTQRRYGNTSFKSMFHRAGSHGWASAAGRVPLSRLTSLWTNAFRRVCGVLSRPEISSSSYAITRKVEFASFLVQNNPESWHNVAYRRRFQTVPHQRAQSHLVRVGLITVATVASCTLKFVDEMRFGSSPRKHVPRGLLLSKPPLNPKIYGSLLIFEDTSILHASHLDDVLCPWVNLNSDKPHVVAANRHNGRVAGCATAVIAADAMPHAFALISQLLAGS